GTGCGAGLACLEDGRGRDRVTRIDGWRIVAADGPCKRWVEQIPSPALRGIWPRHGCPVQGAVALRWLDPPTLSEGSRGLAGDQCVLLGVAGAEREGRVGPRDPVAGPGRELAPAPRKVGPGAARVGQGDEHVVLETRLADAPLRIDAHCRAEQHQGLVGEMAAEVEHGAAAGFARPSLRRVAFEARLESRHRPQLTVGDELADGEEVRIPAPVLIRAK